jgi:hypothetical protein
MAGSGCSIPGQPSQLHPVCSWTETIPSNADAVCSNTFRTLRAIISAEIRGDDAAIRRLVPNAAVSGRIIAQGRTLRGQHILFLRVSPSITVGGLSHGGLGVGFHLGGKTDSSTISSPIEVYLRTEKGREVVVGHEPYEDW